jgi:hypothetical protein
MPNVLQNTKPSATFFSRLRVFLFLWVEVKINGLIEIEGKKRTDV